MKYLLMGLGNIGTKRKSLLGGRCVATVDPENPLADFKDLNQCDPSSYQAVVLSIPNQPKLELLQDCLQRGKHVLIEKPLLFPNETKARELLALAKEKQVIWYTSYNHRFEPHIESIKSDLEQGAIGDFYYGRLFYGNGTVRNVIGSWREQGLGVLEDLGSHLLDLTGYLLGRVGQKIIPWSLERNESKSLDHCLMTTEDKRVTLEMSFLSWKNNFSIDLYGSKGSLHMKGLCKWGPSELTLYKRAFPSGVPQEFKKSLVGPDNTWDKDIDHFENQVIRKASSFENDWWISSTLEKIGALS